MECPNCGEKAFEGGAYCFNCGASLVEQTAKLPSVQASSANQSDVPAPAEPVKPESVGQIVFAQATPVLKTVSDALGGEFSWFENPDTETFVESSNAKPQVTPIPIGPRSIYHYAPDALPLGYRFPVQRGPKHPVLWFFFSLLLMLLIVGIIGGTAFAGIYFLSGLANSVPTSQSQTDVVPSQQPLTMAITKVRAEQVYKQVMSQTPLYVESLRIPIPGEDPNSQDKGGMCQIKPDGLHTTIDGTNQFQYCYTGETVLNDFAIQVEMKLLSGDSSGFVLRSDGTGDNFYYFNITPDGQYYIQIEQDGNWGKILDQGSSTSLAPGFNVKNTLSAIAQGSDIYFYVNEVFLTGIHDSALESGQIGLVAAESSEKAEAVYTNAKIWLL